jgi:dolichol-phosphate mannosyltransferase
MALRPTLGESVSGTYEFAYRLRAAARRPASWLQLLKFGIVGASGYLINLAVFSVLADNFGLHHIAAAIGALCVAIANNFLWNRHWTFEPGDGHPAFQRGALLRGQPGCAADQPGRARGAGGRTSLGDLTAQAIAVAVAMPFNFLGNKLWTFT